MASWRWSVVSMSIGKNTESNTHADNRRVVFTFFISLVPGHGHVP
jgi:hypothetical protein